MSILVIRQARVIDPSQKLDRTTDIWIENDKIKAIGAGSLKADREIEAKGLVACPGLIDMHVHLREPGKEEEETIASGSAAALNGGFASVAAMANTDPPVDTQAAAEFVTLQAKRTGKANVFAVGAVTKALAGEELSEMGQLTRGGAVAFSDDGNAIRNTNVMRRALQYARMFDRAIISHAEDPDMCDGGVMNESLLSTVLGLSGRHAVAEEIMIHRDIALARLTEGRLHIAHLSTAGSAELIRRAKAEGVRVTAEVTPHHFTLTEEAVRAFDPNSKMKPPLRAAADVEALQRGLADGTIDVVASDHAPHAQEEKDVEYDSAPFGVIGLETVLPLVLTQLVHTGILTLPEAIGKLTLNPAQILGIPKGTLRPGADADVTIFDPGAEWVIDPSRFKSKSRNCPFAGMRVRGRAVKVIVGGRVHEAGEL